MESPTRDDMNALLNALQLCIASPVLGYSLENNAIAFSTLVDGDTGLEKFKKLIPGRMEHSTYHVEDISTVDIFLLTSFLMLTRLQDAQIISLAGQDNRYRPYANVLKLLPDGGETVITTIADAKDAIFKTIEQKKWPLKKVAELTGLTQVTLSNFKAGGDIRLSNLLKIAKAVGVRVVLG